MNPTPNTVIPQPGQRVLVFPKKGSIFPDVFAGTVDTRLGNHIIVKRSPNGQLFNVDLDQIHIGNEASSSVGH